MPRTYDFAASEEAKAKAYNENHSCFAPFAEIRSGRSETPLADLWGSEAMGFLRGPRHQFRLSTSRHSNPYDNSLVDPVFSWLEQNATGRWNWLERVVNHGHGLLTDIYIEDEPDREAFSAQWGHLFDIDERALEHNARLDTEPTRPRP